MTGEPTAPVPPAGWYPDPQAFGQLRYWDGQRWTEHSAPFTPAPSPAASLTRPSARRPVWLIPLLALALALVAAGVWYFAIRSSGGRNESAIDEATATVNSLLAAARAKDGATACSYMTAGAIAQWEKEQSSTPPIDPGIRPACESSLPHSIFGLYNTYRPVSPAESPDGSQIAFDVESRQQWSHNLFLLEQEDGAWKVALIGKQSDRSTPQALEAVRNGGITDISPYVP